MFIQPETYITTIIKMVDYLLIIPFLSPSDTGFELGMMAAAWCPDSESTGETDLQFYSKNLSKNICCEKKNVITIM